ncbi:MAG: YfiR family protein [Gemmatimonadota bacterium]
MQVSVNVLRRSRVPRGSASYWRRFGLPLLLVLLALAALVDSMQAQDMEAPVDIQVSLLYKILTFDRNLGARALGDDIVIAIVYQTGYRPSMVARDQVQDALKKLKDSTISGHPMHWVAVELTTPEALGPALAHNRVDVIYVAPLRGVDLGSIIAAARATLLTTFTGVPRYVERGLAVGVGIANERPQIIVNLTAARAEGSDFTSQLLRVSKVIE